MTDKCDMCARAKSLYVGVDGKPVLARYYPFCGSPIDKEEIQKEIGKIAMEVLDIL